MRTDRSDIVCAGLFARGYFAAIDYHFARFITQKAHCADEAVLLAAALTSRQTRMGHVCCDLNTMAGLTLSDEIRVYVSAAGAVAQLACGGRLRWRARRNKAADSGCV